MPADLTTPSRYSIRELATLASVPTRTVRFCIAQGLMDRKRPATTILTARAGLVQRQPALSFQRCGSSSSTRLAG